MKSAVFDVRPGEQQRHHSQERLQSKTKNWSSAASPAPPLTQIAMLTAAPVVWLGPVVHVSGALSPLFGVEAGLDGHQLVADAPGPAGEAPLPARVSLRQADAGEHVPPVDMRQRTGQHSDGGRTNKLARKIYLSTFKNFP